jgi:imidazolonepropionase-like amidohydrolase
MTRTLLACCLTALLSAPAQAQVAVHADTVWTMAGAPLRDGVVIVDQGKIVAVGAADEIAIPDGHRVIRGAVLTPGLIDAHASVGLTGITNQPADQDHRERSHPIQPALRALDGYNPAEELVAYLRGLGVTTVHVGPSPGNLVGGQTLVVKTHGLSVDEASLQATAMMLFTLGDRPKNRFAADQGPTTRMANAAKIREALAAAQDYDRKRRGKDPPGRDLGLEALARVARGEQPALFIAHRADDILTALRIAREFDLDLVLGGATEAYLVRDAIQAAGVPVLVGPTTIRDRPGETRNATFENAAFLNRAEIPIGMATGFEGYVPKVRVVLWEAAIAASNGLGAEATLRALTLDAAKILGIHDRTGSIEVGKDADLALFDGDPLEHASHVCAVLIDGKVVSETCN